MNSHHKFALIVIILIGLWVVFPTITDTTLRGVIINGIVVVLTALAVNRADGGKKGD